MHPATENALTAHGVLAVVCDDSSRQGTGVASARLAAEVVVQRYARIIDRNDPHDALHDAAQSANRSVHALARRGGVGATTFTTCTALAIRGGAAYCAHVGDSRVYLARRGVLYLMTEDHTAAMALVHAGALTVRDARWHEDRRVLTRALGLQGIVDVASWPAAFLLHPGDRFLLCTRSVHEAVPESVLQHALGSLAPSAVGAALITAARAFGAGESLTLAIVAH